MAEQIAKFRFQGFKVLESNFKILSDFSGKPEDYSVDLMPSFEVLDSTHSIKLTLETKITTENKLVEIYVKAESIFDFDSDIDGVEKQNYFKKNAPAIMFPYVRAYISALSALSGIPVITLPTINLVAKTSNGTEV